MTGYDYLTQQQDFTNQGAMETVTAGNASTTGFVSAAGTILSKGCFQFRTRVRSNSQTPTVVDLY